MPAPVPITHFTIGPVQFDIERTGRTFTLTVLDEGTDDKPRRKLVYTHNKRRVYSIARRIVDAELQHQSVPDARASAVCERLERLRTRPFWRD